jgi:hypothetical protein
MTTVKTENQIDGCISKWRNRTIKGGHK